MSRKWHDKLTKEQLDNIDALEKADLERWHELRKDKYYRYTAAGLRASLGKFQKRESKLVMEFFKKFGFFTHSKLEQSREFLSKVEDKEICTFFSRYLNFSARFGIVWKLFPRKRHPRVFLQPSWGERFLCRIDDGRLLPYFPLRRDEEITSLFERPDLQILPELEAAIRARRAAYVEIDDRDGSSSALSRLLTFGYFQDRITFVLHKAEHPYIFCLVGEKVDSETWQRSGKIVKALQKKCFKRVQSGRPPDLERFEKIMKLRNRNQPLKNAAADLDERAEKFESSKVFVSRAAKLAEN